jgi:RHS repeat-associated protein
VRARLLVLNARYYDPARGQFTSQDPVFRGDPREMDLSNPQSLNSYSYALNNPISNKDPNGEEAITAAALVTILVSLAAIAATLSVIQAAGGGNSQG